MYVDIFFQYSILKRKLYINQNRFVNVEFRIDDKKRVQKPMLFVRALCIYIQTDHFGEPVKVSYQHLWILEVAMNHNQKGNNWSL